MDKKGYDILLYVTVIATALFLIYGLFAAQYLLLFFGLITLALIPKIKMHSDMQ